MGLSGVRIAKLIFPGNARGERERESRSPFSWILSSPLRRPLLIGGSILARSPHHSRSRRDGERGRCVRVGAGYVLWRQATSPQFRRHPFVGEGCIPAGCPDLRGGRGGGGGVGDIPGGVCYILSMSVTSPTPPLHRPRTVTAKTVDFVQGSMVAGG